MPRWLMMTDEYEYIIDIDGMMQGLIDWAIGGLFWKKGAKKFNALNVSVCSMVKMLYKTIIVFLMLRLIREQEMLITDNL